MLFWSAIAVMLGIAIALVLWPLGRSAESADPDDETADAALANPGSDGQDIAVFKDQLEEIERDLKRGVLNEQDADSARIEVSRRLIEASKRLEESSKETKNSGASGLVFRRIAAVGAFIGIPVLAAFLYISQGNPSEPDQPLLARAQQSPPTDKTEVASIVEQVETHLSSNPDDVKGWQVIAPVYMRMSRYADAVRAFESIIRLSGDDTERLSDLGEALVLNEQGMITARAQGIFEKSLALDKTAVRPRYFLALGLGQEGNYQAAKTAWEALLEDATPQSAWAPGALEQLNIARAELGLPKAEPDNKAAAVMAMSKDEQQDMIAGMVAGLAARLEEDPNNLPDWLRLIRSYGVLGRTEDAQAALQKALQTFETDQSALAQLAEIAAITGLTQPATSN